MLGSEHTLAVVYMRSSVCPLLLYAHVAPDESALDALSKLSLAYSLSDTYSCFICDASSASGLPTSLLCALCTSPHLILHAELHAP